METDLNSGSSKRPCETDEKESDGLCLHQDVLAGLPNELWAEIVPHLGIRDWGRLEPVSKHFRNILWKYSWTTLETLTVDPNINFCPGKALKIQICLGSGSDPCPDEGAPLSALGLLPGLSCPALRKFQFSTYIRSLGSAWEVAQILAQTKETLTELDLCFLLDDIDEDFVIGATEVLQPVFSSLSNLESLSIVYHNKTSIGLSSPKFNEYLLMNKPKLTSLSLEIVSNDYDDYNYFQPARALLDSKAELEKLYLDYEGNYGEFLLEYEKQLKQSLEPHPLSSLKRFDSQLHLDLGSDGLRLLRLCPDLKEIYGHGITSLGLFDDDSGELDNLISFMGAFLNNYALGEWERVLQLNMPYSQENFQEEEEGRLEELTGPLVKTVQNVPCPEFQCAILGEGEMLVTVPVKVFRKRNALFRLALAIA